jgi:hypothetical protein
VKTPYCDRGTIKNEDAKGKPSSGHNFGKSGKTEPPPQRDPENSLYFEPLDDATNLLLYLSFMGYVRMNIRIEDNGQKSVLRRRTRTTGMSAVCAVIFCRVIEEENRPCYHLVPAVGACKTLQVDGDLMISKEKQALPYPTKSE